MSFDKPALLAEVLRQLGEERDILIAAQRASREGAVHEESRAEGDKDTRATEASYLARGQAQRVMELETEIARLNALELRSFGSKDAIAAGAICVLRSDRGTSTVLLLPGGAGAKLSAGGTTLRVVTPASPLGSSLLGQSAGDEIDVELGERVDEYVVVSVD